MLDQEDDAAVWVLDQEDERMQQCGCLTKKTAECVGVIQRNTQKSKHYCSFENRSSGRTFPNATVRSRTDVSSRTLVNVVELESCIRFRAFRNATEHPRTGVLYRDAVRSKTDVRDGRSRTRPYLSCGLVEFRTSPVSLHCIRATASRACRHQGLVTSPSRAPSGMATFVKMSYILRQETHI